MCYPHISQFKKNIYYFTPVAYRTLDRLRAVFFYTGTIQHGIVLIIVSLILQTVVTEQNVITGGEEI